MRGCHIARKFDPVIMMAVFALCGIYIWSWFTNDIRLPYKYWIQLKPMQIQYALTECVIACLLLWKAYRLGSCIFTKIATWSYVLLVLSSLFYLVFELKSVMIMNILLVNFVLTTLIMAFTYTWNLCYSKFGK